MDNRGLPPQTSNFDCLPGRAGGTPIGLGVAILIGIGNLPPRPSNHASGYPAHVSPVAGFIFGSISRPDGHLAAVARPRGNSAINLALRVNWQMRWKRGPFAEDNTDSGAGLLNEHVCRRVGKVQSVNNAVAIEQAKYIVSILITCGNQTDQGYRETGWTVLV